MANQRVRFTVPFAKRRQKERTGFRLQTTVRCKRAESIGQPAQRAGDYMNGHGTRAQLKADADSELRACADACISDSIRHSLLQSRDRLSSAAASSGSRGPLGPPGGNAPGPAGEAPAARRRRVTQSITYTLCSTSPVRLVSVQRKLVQARLV